MYTEKQAIAALRRLEKNWPEGYTLFSWSGSLHLLKNDLMPNSSGYGHFDGFHEAAIIETFPGIRNDGGDPD